jgi:hypothetical protein
VRSLKHAVTSVRYGSPNHPVRLWANRDAERRESNRVSQLSLMFNDNDLRFGDMIKTKS